MAELAGMSPTTGAPIENGQGCYLNSIVRLGAALGAALRLLPRGSAAKLWTAAAASYAHQGWTTPPKS